MASETITADGMEIPVTNIGVGSVRETVGNVPPRTSVDRVYRWDGQLVGETFDVARGSIIEAHYHEDDVSGDVYVDMHEVDNPSDVDPAEGVLWERDDRAEKELSELVSEGGLSAAEALDYWMVEIRGRTSSEWAEYRRASHQAISKNVRKAREKLAE